MKLLFRAAVASAAIASGALAQAQYPERPITWVVPFAAGGATDTLARQFAERMGKNSRHPIVVENVAGAGGTVGAVKVAKAKPDGYTFLVGHMGYMGAAPGLYKSLGYDPTQDFDAVARFPDTPMVLICAKGHPRGNIANLVEYGRANPARLNFANAGVGSAGHLTAALFASAIRVDIMHVAYKGNAPAVTDIMGGRVDCMFDQSNTALPQVRGGKVDALVATSRERLPQMPDVPTLNETAAPGFDASTWYGIYAPRGTPRDVIDWMVARMDEAMKDQAFTSKMVEQGYVLVSPQQRGPVALSEHTRREVARWKKVIADARIPQN